MSSPLVPFEPDEACARRLDADGSPLPRRGDFLLPRGSDGRPLTYLCGHSLGLQPAAARALVEQELDDWARLGVEGHFRGATPWYAYHETLRDDGARLVGALPHEVVFMNSLTVNLHLLMATFYRPAGGRRCILIDEPAFPVRPLRRAVAGSASRTRPERLFAYRAAAAGRAPHPPGGRRGVARTPWGGDRRGLVERRQLPDRSVLRPRRG